jgi:phage tail-like protein
VIAWINAYHMLPVPTAGQIICLDQSGTVIMAWEMMGVSPVAWTGPTMDATTNNIATERLELAHMGFL